MKNALALSAAALALLMTPVAHAEIIYLVSAPGAPATFSWEAPTFIIPPTSANPGPVDITGLVSCTVAGKPCTNTPTLTFEAGGGGEPDTILASIQVGGGGFGAFLLPSDFGAVGTYVDVFAGSARGTLTVSTAGTIPEPSTWAMMALGFAGLGVAGYWRRRRVSPFAA